MVGCFVRVLYCSECSIRLICDIKDIYYIFYMYLFVIGLKSISAKRINVLIITQRFHLRSDLLQDFMIHPKKTVENEEPDFKKMKRSDVDGVRRSAEEEVSYICT